MTSKGRGGRRYPPYVFTEQGVAMLSSVLRSNRAVQVNIEIMRAFVRLRQILASHAVLARKLAELERKYDAKFKIVFDAIRELMEPPAKKRRSDSFHPITQRKAGETLGASQLCRPPWLPWNVHKTLNFLALARGFA